MTSQPSVVLVPGSFCHASMYDSLVTPFRTEGYDIHVLEPPCYPAGYNASSGTAHPSMYDDAKFINKFVMKLADDGKEVIVIAHSYGGCAATESLKDVTKKEREQQGKTGGVVRLAYLAAAVPRLGESCGHTLVGGKGAPIDIDENGWMSQSDPAATAAICFNNITLEEGISHVAKFGKHYSACFGDVITHAGYKYLPVSWFFAKEDFIVLPEVQQTSINVIEESWIGTEREGKTVDITKLACDHFPLVIDEKREHVSVWIKGVVAKGGCE
ncbi:hypothetical protein G6011_10701 [Alternaria panax]|uniref:AB hydrolase-1 domain-containing protein n=1 Tax=Alternaria panax TaxID=48097 RepID=A0AAD4IC38_9PLEO|nr:hypothetical protein G6011_10701 [Alternaria panax]